MTNLRQLNLMLIAGIFIIYLFSAKGYIEILDTTFSVATAVSLFDRGSLEVEHAGEGTLRAANGKLYSKYGVGLPFTYLPYVALGTIVSRVVHLPRLDLVNFFISFSNIPYGIATLFFFSRLLRKLDISERSVCTMTVALGLGTLCWRYADYDFSEEIQMALLTLAALGVVRPMGADLVWAGISLGCLFILKTIYILLLPFFGLYLLFQVPPAARIKAAISVGGPILIACGVIGMTNAIRFGSPFESGYGSEAHQFNAGQIVHVLPWLLFSLRIGIFAFCPMLILALAGWPAFFRKHLFEALLCLGLIATNLLWTAAWHGWDGGWNWGPRLLVPLLPFWLLPVVFLIESPRLQRWFPAFVIFLGLNVVWQLPGILVKDQEIHYARIISTKQETKGMVTDIPAGWIFLYHKLTQPGEVYRITDLTSSADNPQKVIDFSSFRTFQGFNVWTEQTSRQLHQPWLRCLPLFGLLGLAGLLATWMRSARSPSPR
jgi:hypothetical protein